MMSFVNATARVSLLALAMPAAGKPKAGQGRGSQQWAFSELVQIGNERISSTGTGRLG